MKLENIFLITIPIGSLISGGIAGYAKAKGIELSLADQFLKFGPASLSGGAVATYTYKRFNAEENSKKEECFRRLKEGNIEINTGTENDIAGKIPTNESSIFPAAILGISCAVISATSTFVGYWAGYGFGKYLE